MALDGLLALALVGLGQWELWMTPQADTAKHVGHSVVGVVLAVLVTAPVAVRRRWSRSALALVLIGAYLQAVLSYQDQNTTVFGLLFGVYAVALAHSRWFSIPGALLAAGYPLSRELLINHDAALQFAFALVFVAVIMVTTWVVGDMQRRRLRRIADAERDAERTRRESDARAMRAAEEERTRIARELHDVVVMRSTRSSRLRNCSVVPGLCHPPRRWRSTISAMRRGRLSWRLLSRERSWSPLFGTSRRTNSACSAAPSMPA
jgi:hypothetical protein